MACLDNEQFDKELRQLIENLITDETKEMQKKLEKLQLEHNLLKADYEALEQDHDDLIDEHHEQLVEVDALLEYIDTLEKERYFYLRSAVPPVEEIIDKLIKMAKVIRSYNE